MKKKNGIVKSKKKLTAVVVTSLLVLVAALGFLMPNNVKSILTSVRNYFDAGEVPAHHKILTNNNDGTHQIELMVTGDADTEVETAANVNVIIVYDHSSSMTNNVSGGRNSRADQAEDVVYSFVNNLFGYQDEDNPNNIQMALVTFARSASVVEGWTSNERTIRDHFDQGGTDGRTVQNYSSSNNANNGTNWDAALGAANDLLNGTNGQTAADGDPTFVILVTDGAPTASGNGNNAINPSGASLNDLLPFYRAARNNARSIQSRDNTTLFGIYAYGTEADLLDDLMYYSNTGSDRASITAASVSTDNYYNAGNTDSLNQAITEIFGKIVEALGISAVSIDDGTTNGVEISSDAPLLNVDESSYKYWLQVPIDPNTKQFQRVDLVSGETITYTVRDNGNGTLTITWDGGSQTVDGKIDPTTGSFFKYEWKEANSLYDKAPPEAKLENGSVKWNLNSVGTLLDGVTYSVTFDVYPSQDTYDFIAEIKNIDDVGDRKNKYDALDPDVKEYLKPTSTLLDESGYFDFTLRTNTEATLSYTDTRTGESNTTTFEPQDPVATTAGRMKVTKTWENDLDYKTEKATVNVKQDGEPYLSNIELTNETPDVTNVEEFFIATGLMKVNKATGEISILDHGYDYTFSESGADDYNWELVSETVRPMIINGQLTKLVKLDENATKIYTEDGEPKYTKPESMDGDYLAEGGKEYYKINGEIYVAVPDTGLATLSATNYRRSNLNISKTVDGVSAPTNDEFTYTLDIQDAGATDDLWFSIENADGSYDTSQSISGTRISGNYYVLPKDTVIEGITLTFTLNNGDNIRFINLTTKTTYTVEETDMPDNYRFDKAEAKGTYGANTETDSCATVSGKVVDGTIGLTNSLYEVNYTNIYEKINIPVKKVWTNDDDGKEGLREEIDVQLYANGNKVEGDEGIGHLTSENTDDEGNWVYTFEDLDRYANGESITYTVQELTDLTPHYKSSEPTGDMATGFTITNTRENTDKYTSVSGTKTWEDNNDQDGERPKTIQINLYKDNGQTYVKSTTVSAAEDGSWSYSFTGLPKYEGGQEIVYSVTEKPVDFYTTTTGTTANDFINTHTTFKTKVVVDKEWNDNDNQDGKRGPITVKLSNHGLQPETKQLTEDNNWHVEWTDLDRRSSGTDIDYQVTEVVMPEEYKQDGDPTVTETVDQTTMAKTITIKFKNKHELQTRDIKVTKIWDDNNDQDGVRPTSIDVTLKANGETADVKDATVTLNKGNNWTYTWKGLYTNSNASEIEYTVEEDEDALPDSYSLESIEGDMDKGFTITNTHELETRDIEVTKVWDDNDDQDGVRPNSIDVTLKANGETADVDDATVTLNAGNNWYHKWEGLYTNASGDEIEYTVEEDTSALPSTYSWKSTTGDMSKGYTITNTHELEKRNIKVTKEWNDKNNQDGIRPTSVTVTLKANGEAANVDDATVTLNKDNNWTHTWEDVDTNSEGSEITYTVEEDTDALPSTYSLESITGSMAQGFVVKNKHVPDVTSVIVKKEWIDELPDKYRPSSVEVTLKANGEVPTNVSPTTVTLNEATNWTYIWTGLDKNSDGQRIKYTVTEKAVENYTTVVDVKETDTQVNIAVVNTINDLKKDIPVEKVWSDDNNRDGLRGPVTVTITGRIGEDVVPNTTKSVTLSEGNNWKSTFTDLPIFYNAKLISYSIQEEVPEGYSAEYSGNSDDGFVVTNTHEPVKIKITGTKTWNDEGNVDGARPESITINLLKNGSQFKSTTVQVDQETGNWTFEFDDLYKCENGSAIKYSITEEAVGGYSSTISDVNEDNTVTVINTHTPETISYKITKSWDDLDNNDGVRPSSITVRLLADGTEIKSAVLNEGNGWSYTWSNLPKYKTGSVGVLVQYTIIEDEVKGYNADFTDIETTKETTSINNTITNKHTPEVHEDIKVTKTWADDNNKYGVRPEKITVRLLANGKEIKVCELTAANGWTYTFTGLLKYMNGELVVYTIVEDPVLNYKTKIDGFDITNIYDGPHGEIVPPNTMVSGSALGTTTNTSNGGNFSVLFLLILGIVGLMFRKEANN